METLINKEDGVEESFIFGKPISKDPNDIKIFVKIVYNKESFEGKTETEIKEYFNEKIKSINKTMPHYKAIRGIIISDKPLIKTTTNKIKRENNRDSIIKMIQKREKDNIKQSENYFLGEKIEIRICDTKKTFFDGQTLYSNSKENIEKWYKKKCEIIFKEHLDNIYNNFSKKVPYPSLTIRKMKTRWGVCNKKLQKVTLNYNLIYMDTKYLDYVIVHELSHFIHFDHSKNFWSLVEENEPNYRKIRKEMRE